jgi:hypothetical protein
MARNARTPAEARGKLVARDILVGAGASAQADGEVAP